MTAIWWPKYVNTLSTSGVWAAIVARISNTGFTDAITQCEEVLRELRQLERQEVRNAISGEGFQTIWQRQQTDRPS
jgi:hypothetical protein